MLQWFANNSEGLVALLGLVSAVLVLLTKAGVIQKARGDLLTKVIEDAEGAVARSISEMRAAKKDGVLTDAEIAQAIAKGLKGEARERAVKSGMMSVVKAVAVGAAEVDPKKPKVGKLRRLGAVIRSIIPFAGG